MKFVTGNPNKVAEASRHLGMALEQVQRPYPEIQADSLEEVARAGAQWLLDDGLEPPFVLEDAGLFIHALSGFPGVYSRYVNDSLGCAGILRLMAAVEEEVRTAHFAAVVAHVDARRQIHVHSGRVDGKIATRCAGKGGFGYDPIFIPLEGNGQTFAEMTADEKAKMSHRSRAFSAFQAALSKEAKP